MSNELDLSSNFNPHLEKFSFPVDEVAELPGPSICCPGKLRFQLVFDGDREDRGCRVFEMGGIRRLFVNLNRCFTLNATFRIPLTPMNLAIRLVPLFVSPQRWCDPVLRCANHTEASGPEKDIIKRRSFLTVSSPDTVYSFTGPKLRGDHLNLCIPINKLRSAASGVKEEDNVSSSQESLLLVTESITCRLHCFSSCFGSEERGRIELVARLEDLTGPEPIILGMDRVEVRCSATPSRDINRLRDRLLSKSCGSSEGPPATAKASPMSGPGRKNLMLTSTDSSANSQMNNHMPNSTAMVSHPPYIEVNGRRFYVVVTPSLRNYRGLQAFRDSFVNTTTKCDRPTVIVDPTLQTQFREDMLRYERKLVRAWQRHDQKENADPSG
uniref:p53 DNA-binding domain-containing protein n=1 Tax=Schistocephalus solidus TaxID=70667 RepID=A0A0X3PTX8_SCHSO